jgi:hypothetical protein
VGLGGLVRATESYKESRSAVAFTALIAARKLDLLSQLASKQEELPVSPERLCNIIARLDPMLFVSKKEAARKQLAAKTTLDDLDLRLLGEAIGEVV